LTVFVKRRGGLGQVAKTGEMPTRK